MATYETPGAYIEREDRAQGGISRLRTDIAAFVGIAERGPARRAVAIESWKQFTAVFGALFENAGRRCWGVRVEGEAAQIAGTVLRANDAGNTPVWSVQANSSGAWGNGLSVRLLEVRRVARRSIKATVDWVQADSIAGFARTGTVELIQQSGGSIRSEQGGLSAVDASRSRFI